MKVDAGHRKATLMRAYAFAVYFGHGYTGLTAASRGYFGREAAALSWSRACMLAGLVQAPSAYDPVLHLDLARSRQRHVVDRLVATGRLTRGQGDRVVAAPRGLR